MSQLNQFITLNIDLSDNDIEIEASIIDNNVYLLVEIENQVTIEVEL